MHRLLDNPLVLIAAALLLLASLVVSSTVSDVIDARRDQAHKETIDQFIDLAKEGIQIWTPK